ncbi:unnamed protein product [Symbiodinium natans]|uniref:Uncharacterized protein n=1 Tax=Symbiodinium natans TaxID=878477 RepID=A0A812RKG4_9DINO|nr:unnamed protein product [Symbiodinium natans]
MQLDSLDLFSLSLAIRGLRFIVKNSKSLFLSFPEFFEQLVQSLRIHCECNPILIVQACRHWFNALAKEALQADACKPFKDMVLRHASMLRVPLSSIKSSMRLSTSARPAMGIFAGCAGLQSHQSSSALLPPLPRGRDVAPNCSVSCSFSGRLMKFQHHVELRRRFQARRFSFRQDSARFPGGYLESVLETTFQTFGSVWSAAVGAWQYGAAGAAAGH